MLKTENFDFTVIGAGIFGLFAANLLAQKNLRVCVVELDDKGFSRASTINQARVHQGYHYPRSLSTAKVSARHFERFIKDFGPAINKEFKKIYAIANRSSYTSSRQFLKFCEFCDIPVKAINPAIYFNQGTAEGAYETEEFTFDPTIVKELLVERNKAYKNIQYLFEEQLINAEKGGQSYFLEFSSGLRIKSGGVFNCTYASVNQILDLFGFDLFNIKYEICEVVLCNVNANLKNLGITMMDGPFFSIMPYGKTGLHTLTSVEFTPRKTSLDLLPQFSCQDRGGKCTPKLLQNCNTCSAKPNTSFNDMLQITKKYLKSNLQISYKESLFAIKPILMASEMDDSRPTIVQTYSESPLFVSVLSGKINAIYELEQVTNGI